MKCDQLLDIKYDTSDELNVLVAISDYLVKQMYLEQFILEDGELSNEPIGQIPNNSNNNNNQQVGFIVTSAPSSQTQPQTQQPEQQTQTQPNQDNQNQQTKQDTQQPQQNQQQKPSLMTKIKNVLIKIWGAISSFFKKIGEKLKNLKNKITGKNNVEISNTIDPEDTGEVPNLKEQQDDADVSTDVGTYAQGQEQPDRVNQEKELQDLQQQNEDLSQKVKQLEASVQTAQEDKQQLETKFNQLSEQMNDVNQQINNMIHQQQNLQNDVNNIQYDVNNIQSDIQTNINDVDNKINNLQQQITQAQNNQDQYNENLVNNLNQQLQQARLERQQLQDQINQNNSNASGQIGYLNSMLSNLQGYVNGVTQKADESIALATSAKATVDSQIVTMSRLNELVNSNIASGADRDARVANIQSSQENINNAIANLQNMTNGNNSELQNIMSTNQMIIQRLNELENNIIQNASQNPNNTLTPEQIKQIIDNEIANNMVNQNTNNVPTQQPQDVQQPQQSQTQPIPQQTTQQQPQQVQQPQEQPQSGFDNVLSGAENNIANRITGDQPLIQTPPTNQTNQQRVQPTINNVKNIIGSAALELLVNARKQINNLTELNNKIEKSQTDLKGKLEGTVDQVVERVKSETKNVGNKAKAVITNLSNIAQNNIVKYKDIPNDLKNKYMHLRFNIEIRNNDNAIINVPIVYAYNVPKGIFELCYNYFNAVNGLISTIAGLASKAKVDVGSDINVDTNASYKNITTYKNQIGQINANITNVLNSGQAEIITPDVWQQNVNKFTDELTACNNNSEKLNNLLPSIMKAQEDNNNQSGNNKANVNRINNLLKAAIDGSNYVIKSLKTSIGSIDDLVDKITFKEQNTIYGDINKSKNVDQQQSA